MKTLSQNSHNIFLRIVLGRSWNRSLDARCSPSSVDSNPYTLSLSRAKMLIMDPRAFGGFEELLLQCAAYGARTGGRFLACDFEKDVTRGEEVRDAWDSVEAFKEKIRLAAHDERSELVVQYVAAYRETLHEAALQTMAAALASVDRFQGSNARRLRPFRERASAKRD